MKKLFLISILLLLLCKCAPAQQQFVCVWYTSNDTVMVGDSAWIDVKYIYNTGHESDVAHVYMNDYANTYNVDICNMTYGQLDALPRHTVGTDIVIRINFAVPHQCNAGKAKYVSHCNVDVYVDSVTGALTIIPSSAPDPRHVIKTEYYDQLGNRISAPKTGQLNLKVNSYSDGTIETHKQIIRQ